MTILSAQSIRRRCISQFCNPIVSPFYERTIRDGMTFGLSSAGYDVRIRESILFWPFRFVLASTIEHFEMPKDVLAHVCDKSSWARQGLFVQNTIIEPSWCGTLTLEITLNSFRFLRVKAGSPIAQIVFHRLEEPTEQPYKGKYSNQPARPVKAILE